MMRFLSYLLYLITFLSAVSVTGCGDGTSDRHKSSLSDKMDITLEGQPYEATCADFNGDGWDDLAVTVKYSGVYVFFNNGENFDEYKKFTGIFPHGISIKHGDFNGDGNIDLVVLVEDGIQFFVGDGKGNFIVSGKTYAAPVMSSYIEVADLNNDALPDLIAVGQNDSRVFLYINKGDLNFQIITINLEIDDALFAPEFKQVSAADLDGDGFTDILLADYQNKAVWIIWNEGGDIFLPDVIYTADALVSSVVLYKKEGTSLPDIVFAEQSQDGGIVFLKNNGNRRFDFSKRISVYPLPMHLRVADINSDAYNDLIITHLTSDEPLKGRISVLYGPDFAKTYNTTISGISFYSAACDWNRDGRPDIFSPNISADSVTYIPSDIIK